MLALRGCQRCGGDLTDADTPDERACIQCGNRIYATAPLPFVRERTGAVGDKRRTGMHRSWQRRRALARSR